MKHFFGRPRPELVPYLSQVYTSSFPSGHSLIAAVVYLTLGSILASVISKLSLKIYVMAVAVLLTVAVGLTRIYLGVHYPTDVLAGWLAGFVVGATLLVGCAVAADSRAGGECEGRRGRAEGGKLNRR